VTGGVKMARIRQERVAEQMRKEISDLMRTEIKDPGIGFSTVTRVEVAGDLQHAKVFVSVYGSDEEKKSTMAALTRASGFIRGEIGRRLRLRVSPELSFKLDESSEYSAHIETVLRRLDGNANEKDDLG
jgi:ribosome-binding factor A